MGIATELGFAVGNDFLAIDEVADQAIASVPLPGNTVRG